ncbi:uncharacterized protein LOC135464791 [Liolophura sinensis]|uniref:uncharacterized protein LOC135464791 n=1 Tax=Liolophura sinensis TaxID=3198878 RepID=UPI003159925E
MAKSLVTALPASSLVGACAVLISIAFLFCCAKRRSSTQTLRNITFNRRRDAVTGLTNDTVVLQFVNNTGSWRNDIVVDTASVLLSQQNRTTKAHAFGQNVAGFGQSIPARLGNAGYRYGQRGQAVEDKVTLVDNYEDNSQGHQSRRDLLALKRGLPEAPNSKKKFVLVPKCQPDDERSGLPHIKEVPLSEPFGPYDVIKSRGLEKKEEPFYHVLEEQPKEESLSHVSDRRAEPFVHILPRNPRSDVAVNESQSPHLRPPLKNPEHTGEPMDALSTRIRMDYEYIDDESINNPEASAGANRKDSFGAQSPNPKASPSDGVSASPHFNNLPCVARSASPQKCHVRKETPETRQQSSDVNSVADWAAAPFKPWPGCPQKVLLLQSSNHRVVVNQEANGCHDTTKSELHNLYSKVKKAKHNANYRPVVKVPCGGSDFTKKQITCSQNSASDYDHIGKPSLQILDITGSSIYNRCRPEEDCIPGSTGQYSKANKSADWNQALREVPTDVGADDSSSEAAIFYDRLARPNFKCPKPSRILTLKE